jgi:hypothetical protein
MTIVRKLASIGAVAALGALSLGCADNNTTIFIRQVQFPEVQDNCAVTNDPGAAQLGQGFLDTLYRGSYQGWLLVGNQMLSRSDPTRLKIESHRVQIYEADITVFDAAGAERASYTVPVSGFVDSSQGQAPSYGLVNVPLIDEGTGSTLTPGQTVISRVQVFGESLGGVEVESGVFDFPIFVCRTGAVDDFSCLGCLAADLDAEVAPVCTLGQDIAPDCRVQSAFLP